MYIYLRGVLVNYQRNFTSKTLFYQNRKRIWKPAFESPYMMMDSHQKNWLRNFHSGYIQIQKLYTNQNRSLLSGLRDRYSVRNYRGKYGGKPIIYYGTYRYRLVKNGKKTQWRTISIMNNRGIDNGIDSYSIK